MSRLKGLTARLRDFLRPDVAERRMDEEFAFHVEMETRRLRAEGFSTEDARRLSRASFGGFDRYREEMREGRGALWLSDLRSDLRYGARMLRKTRGLTLIAVLSLAVGIGANAAIFSLVNAILLRPRAVAAPERLIQVYGGDRQHPYQSLSWPSYRDLRDRNDILTGLAAYGVGWQFRLNGTDDTEQVWGEVVSGNYFDVLGVGAYRGRTFALDEDVVPGRNPVAVIGYGLWQRRFAADPVIVGKAIVINNHPFTIIGVAPPRYTGMMSGWASEIWVPITMAPVLQPSNGELLLTRNAKWLTLVGRLAPGVGIDQARARFDVVTASVKAEHPGEWQESGGDQPARESFASVLPERDTRIHPAMRVPAYALAALLFGVVNLVLAIACMNLAALLFARGLARHREIAVRLAMGASRSRIVRQLLTESVLLALMAGVAGVALGFWALEALIGFMPALPEGIRLALDVRLDWRVVLFTMLFATLAGTLFGLGPALRSSRSSVASVLKDDAGTHAGPRRGSRTRNALVMVQVAFSLLLMIGAGLMLRSLDRVVPTRLGFATENMIVAPVALDESRYDRRAAQRFHERVSEDIAALPGVESVSLVREVPGGFLSRTRRSTEIEGYTPRPDESLEIDVGIVGPRYFTNMRVPVVAGRDFDGGDRDGAPCVAMVNEAFARRYLGGTAPALGKHLSRGGRRTASEREMCAIVGVVRDDAFQSLQPDVRPFYALPWLQSDQRRMTVLVNTAGDPSTVVPGVRRVIRALDAAIPVSDVQTLRGYFDTARYPFRVLGWVLAACGGLALLLATMGIYGTVSYAVAQRRREVGIRLALGAVRTDVVGLVVGQGMVVVAYGLAAGGVLGALLARALVSLPLDMPLLFGVSATDAATFAGATLLLVLVALAACVVPALRAARVDPALTLRSS